MVYSVILHVPRKPGLSPEEFKHHWEKIHIPLLKQLVGYDFPLSHTRHYIERPFDSTLERGDLTKSEGPSGVGAIDGVAILTFASKEHYERFGEKLTDEKKRRVYESDLQNFVDVGAMNGMFAVSTCNRNVFDTLNTNTILRARPRLLVGMGAWLAGDSWAVFDDWLVLELESARYRYCAGSVIVKLHMRTRKQQSFLRFKIYLRIHSNPAICFLLSPPHPVKRHISTFGLAHHLSPPRALTPLLLLPVQPSYGRILLQFPFSSHLISSC